VLKVPNNAFRFKPPEPSTNRNAVARLLAKIGLGGSHTATPTNAAPLVKSGDTNTLDQTAAPAPLTGNETPEELMRRRREYRGRADEPPADLRAKVRELFQSGAIPRTGGEGRGGGGAGAGAARQRPAQPAFRTVYVLVTNMPPGGGEPILVPQPVR